MNLPASLALRPALDADREFLFRVYASTRAEELAVTGWSDAQKEQFLRMQFDAQHRYYHEHMPDAAYLVVLCEGQPAGRLYLDRRHDEIGVVDIALLPEFRDRGIGSVFLREVMAEATAARTPVRLHVEPFNRALNLYHRLGFHKIGDTGVYLHLEWQPLPASEPPRHAGPVDSAAV